MSNKEKEIKLKKALKLQNVFKSKGIQQVNHKPHIYMIGTRHVVHASDNCGGMLGDATLESIPCAQPQCGLFYKDHTSDQVAFLQSIKNSTNDEANIALKAIVKKLGEEFVDGFAFVESKFKITK